MSTYILPPLSKVSLDKKKFPLLVDDSGEYFFREKDIDYPRVIELASGLKLPIFTGGIISQMEISQIVSRIGRSIVERHADKSILLVTLLEGARPFATLLNQYLHSQQVRVLMAISGASIQVRSYTTGSRAKEHQLLRPLSYEGGEIVQHLGGYDVVVLVDDLIDSGDTIAWLIKNCLVPLGSPKIEACFLLEKEIERDRERDDIIEEITPVIGIKVPDEWVVGFGLDISLPGSQTTTERHLFRRHLPGGIYAFNHQLERHFVQQAEENNQAFIDYLRIYQSLR